MQLLSSSAGEKDRKKLVSVERTLKEIEISSQDGKKNSNAFCLPAGVDERDGSDAPDGLQTHQLGAGEDDDDAAHGPAVPRGLPAAVLPVSPRTDTPQQRQKNKCLQIEAMRPFVCVSLAPPGRGTVLCGAWSRPTWAPC